MLKVGQRVVLTGPRWGNERGGKATVAHVGEEYLRVITDDGVDVSVRRSLKGYGICPLVEKKPDAVQHPKHYTSHPSGVEVIEITRHESFLRGNVLKYVLRAPHKGNELEDLRKAQTYLAWEIERVEKESA